MAKPVLQFGGTCRSGRHPWTPENVKVYGNGRRTCIACVRQAQARRRARNLETVLEQQRRWHASRPEEEKRAKRLRKYGISVEEYDALLTRQGGRCAICRTGEPGGRWGTHFAVDHDHETDAIRGLLCGRCNVMLGNAQDDPARLRAAAAYLEEVD